jgi:hypothetical protein
MRALMLAVWLGLACNVLAAAFQSSVSSGQIAGVVTDPSGAVVPGALVKVTSEATGLERTMETDEVGGYRFLLLSPGQYDVTAEREAFQSQVKKAVRVTVGEITLVHFQLQIGQRIQVDVTDFAPIVESERSHQASTVLEENIRQLPIDRRDYLTYTLLVPGVVDSKALADANDFRVPQTRDSGLSFYGSNGRGNNITLDGGEINSATGGVRETISQEAVLEFQINRANYSAELGGATGASINIVSKSGTNHFHGSAYGFFRTSALDAADPFAIDLVNDKPVRVKPPSNRQQFGATLGGPLKLDRTMFFMAFEGLRRRESTAVPVLTDTSIFEPTPDQQRVLSALPAEAAAQLRAVLTSPPATRSLFLTNSGIFPFSSNDYNSSVRIDHQANNRNNLMFRYRFADTGETNPNTRALVGVSRGYDVEALDHGAILSWTHFSSPRSSNQFHVQFDYRNFFVGTNDSFGPELNINGYGFFNRDFALPSSTITRFVQVSDGLTLIQGKHSLKLGGSVLIRGNNNNVRVYGGGRFAFGQLPGGLVSPALASTTITALQAFNLGLPQFYHQGFGSGVVASTIPAYAGYFQDSWKATKNLKIDLGVRYELDVRTKPVPKDTNNWAPRVAFAWNPFAGSTTIRGGYGIFYSPSYYQLDYVANALSDRDGHRQIAQLFTTIQSPGAASASNIYRTLMAQRVITMPTPTRSITAADIEQFGLRPIHDGPVPPQTVLFSHAPDFENSYSQQASFGVEHAFREQVSVGVSYVFASTLKIMRARDKNLLPAPIDPNLGIPVWTAANFKNPLLLQDNVYESSGRAFYHGFVVEATKRLGDRFSGSMSYTFSKAIDEVVDFNADFQANDQTNLRAERALSSFNQRHKLVLYGTALLPAPSSPGLRSIFSNISISPIIRANSGRPFNLLVGSDINGDRHSTSDRPPFAGRNTGTGPNLWTTDLRLTKRISVTEQTKLELIAETFNVLNRLNFQSVNTTVGTMTGPFNVRGRRDRSPSQPLGFTSAYDPRSIQLGVRITY